MCTKVWTVKDINLLNFSDEESLKYLQNTINNLNKKQLKLLVLLTKKINLKDVNGEYFKSEDTIMDLSADYFLNAYTFTLDFYIAKTYDREQSSAGGLLVRYYFNLLFTNYSSEDLKIIKFHIKENLRSL